MPLEKIDHYAIRTLKMEETKEFSSKGREEFKMSNEYAFKGSQCFSTLGDISTPVTSNPTESKALNISPLPHPRSISLFLLLSFSSDLRNLANLEG